MKTCFFSLNFDFSSISRPIKKKNTGLLQRAHLEFDFKRKIYFFKIFVAQYLGSRMFCFFLIQKTLIAGEMNVKKHFLLKYCQIRTLNFNIKSNKSI